VSTEFAAHPVSVIAYTIRNAVAASGFSRTRIYQLIGQGEIETRKDGRKTLVLAESLHSYITGLPHCQQPKLGVRH